MFDSIGLTIDLGGVIIQFCPHSEEVKLVPANHFKPFSTKKKPDHKIQVKRFDHYIEPPKQPNFSTDYWVIQCDSNRMLYHLQLPNTSGLYEVYQFENKFEDGTEFCTLTFSSPKDHFEILPIYLDGWLTSYFLSQKEGLLIHSCGINAAGHGCLFSGVSGAGKSTTASLWRDFGGLQTRLLGEERIAVRKVDDRYLMHATPWYATDELQVQGGVLLERLFILHHSPENQIKQLSPADAVKLLIPRSYLPFWDANSMTSSLDFLLELCSSIPCYEFGFTPDKRAVEAVWRLINS